MQTAPIQTQSRLRSPNGLHVLNDDAVLVTTPSGTTTISGNAKDITDSLSLQIAMKTRVPEDIKFRSTNLENWCKQKMANGYPLVYHTASLQVQGVKIPYYVFYDGGVPQFTVWFNLWPVAWIEGGISVYERHDSMKSLYASIEQRIELFGCEPASATVAAPACDMPPAATPTTPTISPYASTAYHIPAAEVTLRLYDGKRTIYQSSAERMNLADAKSCPEVTCKTFDAVFDLVIKGIVSDNFRSDAALFLNVLRCKLPPKVGKISQASEGAMVGQYVSLHSTEYGPRLAGWTMCTVNNYIVSLSRMPTVL